MTRSLQIKNECDKFSINKIVRRSTIFGFLIFSRIIPFLSFFSLPKIIQIVSFVFQILKLYRRIFIKLTAPHVSFLSTLSAPMFFFHLQHKISAQHSPQHSLSVLVCFTIQASITKRRKRFNENRENCILPCRERLLMFLFLDISTSFSLSRFEIVSCLVCLLPYASPCLYQLWD